MKNHLKKFASAALASAVLLALCACGAALPENRVWSASDLPGKTVGVVMGSPASGYLAPFSGDMTIRDYTDAGIMLRDVESGELDCALTDRTTAEQRLQKNKKLETLAEPFVCRSYRIAVSPDNRKLLDKVNGALSALSADGRLAAVTSGGGASGGGEGGSGTLLAAVDPTMSPFEYYGTDGQPAGIEIDVLRAVCGELGVGLELVPADADKMLYLVESGKVSLAIGRLTGTESADLDYSDPYFVSEQLIVVRKSK